MDLSAYAEHAVRLVNTEQPARGVDLLRSAEDVLELIAPVRRIPPRVTDGDVTRLRSVRTRLRAVFTDAAAGREADAVATLNGVLAEFPVHPRLTGHDASPWHLHLAGDAVGAAEGFAAIAGMGLAVQLSAHGIERLGVCHAQPCRNVFLDLSANRSRRHCSDRCATRANVALYRARRKARDPQPDRHA
ncbi:CGNR zinc finger domain-containing protein [Embleya sp. NBC_00896]|uniref:CGNR zinc finger domain-containing protein n=1 Tax=Embleya sp. NBC_00896 TaxID=2975961 RepID=UPI003870EC3E|nr:CGNR zinc finger domain-containing protein [Embleya sp. NBC_00896]